MEERENKFLLEYSTVWKVKVLEKKDLSPVEFTILEMSEGNPGALRVLCELLKYKGLESVVKLQDMNIKGTRIWLCYKDLCRCDLHKLYNLIISGELAEAVLEKCTRDEFFKRDWYWEVRVL